MRNVKMFNEFNKFDREMSDDELEAQENPNYRCIKDFDIDLGDDEGPLFVKGDLVYWDKIGERLIIIRGSNPEMIIDFDSDDFNNYFTRLPSNY